MLGREMSKLPTNLPAHGSYKLPNTVRSVACPGAGFNDHYHTEVTYQVLFSLCFYCFIILKDEDK